MEASFAELKRRLAEIDDLQRTQLLLAWDMEVWMPPSGERSRGAQFATLETIVHDRQIDDRIGELLDDVEPYVSTLPHDADDACLVRVARRSWEKKRRIPTDLAAEIAGAQVESYQAWVKAREEARLRGLPAVPRANARAPASADRVLRAVRRSRTTSCSTTTRRERRPRTCASSFAALQPEITALVAEHAERGA